MENVHIKKPIKRDTESTTKYIKTTSNCEAHQKEHQTRFSAFPHTSDPILMCFDVLFDVHIKKLDVLWCCFDEHNKSMKIIVYKPPAHIK